MSSTPLLSPSQDRPLSQDFGGLDSELSQRSDACIASAFPYCDLSCPYSSTVFHRSDMASLSIPETSATPSGWMEDTPAPPLLQRQNAYAGFPVTPRPSPPATPLLHPQPSPVVQVPELEAFASPSTGVQQEMGPPPPKKRKSQHPKLTIKSGRRVRLSGRHLNEMRTRFLEVMEVIDPVCPTCGRRPSDSEASCEGCL